MDAAGTAGSGGTIDWVVWFVNEYATPTRREAGEIDDDLPDPDGHPGRPPGFELPDPDELTGIADRAFAVFAAAPDPVAVCSALTALFTDVSEVVVTPVEGRPALDLRRGDRPDPAALIGHLLTEIVGAAGTTVLGICEADHCVDVFVDRSRHRSRRFCSTSCQTRTRVARHRRRRAGAGPDRDGGEPAGRS